MKKFSIVLLITASLLLSSCVTYKKPPLIFVTKTSIGLDASVGTTEQGGGVYIYKRFEGIIDPLEGHKAQSVLAKLNFGASSGSNVEQWIAAGDAATELAKRESIAVALSGKNIKLATSFKKGISVSDLSFIVNFYDKVIKDGNNRQKEVITTINETSKKILVKFQKVYEEPGIGDTDFHLLVGLYSKCNKNQECNINTGKTIAELNADIEKKLSDSIIKIIGIANNLLINKKGE